MMENCMFIYKVIIFNKIILNNDHVLNKNVVNISIVYKLDPLASTRDKSFTIQNALFGAM